MNLLYQSIATNGRVSTLAHEQDDYEEPDNLKHSSRRNNGIYDNDDKKSNYSFRLSPSLDKSIKITSLPRANEGRKMSPPIHRPDIGISGERIKRKVPNYIHANKKIKSRNDYTSEREVRR